MKSEEKSGKLKKDTLKLWSRLQIRMALSYVVVSVTIALLIELLLAVIFFTVITPLFDVDQNRLSTAEHTAEVYALEAAIQGNGIALDPHSTFQPGQPASLNPSGDFSSNGVPYTDTQASPSQSVEFALLIAPDGRVLASSYPARYPVSTPAAQLLLPQQQLIHDALAGKAGNKIVMTEQGRAASAAQPVWNMQKKPIGAVYVQMPSEVIGGNFFAFLRGWLATGLFWLVITAPIGTLFGVITTRSLVRRLHRLVRATARFAQGDYTQRVAISKQDEIGQLERQFNQMASQLVESIEQQKALTEQQARLEERARIEQELQTARYIQLALLPKDIPSLPDWQLVRIYRPAREVGGDFYDFHPRADGRLGIVIGDATDKGIPAALLMAMTCTMLRTAMQVSTSPGEVLARVNELLATTIPRGTFATCFYAMLDPASGRLCYANAGHDLPYLRQQGEVSELYATGMPLGLMPGMSYEEKETLLAPGDSILFYSDGLVEAHNEKREMFSFPYLKTLLKEDVAGQELIDFLLGQLAAFTGSDWEQEDDITLLTLQKKN